MQQGDRRVRKTKKALAEGLCRLLAEKNIQNISVRELTDLVDLNRATFYLHYKDIYDLQEKLETDFIEEIAKMLMDHQPKDSENSSYQMFLMILQHIMAHETLCKMLFSENGIDTFKDRLSLLMEEYCLYCIRAYLKNAIPPNKMSYASSFIVAGHVAMIKRWFCAGMVETPEQMASIMESTSMLFRNFKVPETALVL